MGPGQNCLVNEVENRGTRSFDCFHDEVEVRKMDVENLVVFRVPFVKRKDLKVKER